MRVHTHSHTLTHSHTHTLTHSHTHTHTYTLVHKRARRHHKASDPIGREAFLAQTRGLVEMLEADSEESGEDSD